MVCFAHFELQMCFAPQRPAIFPQLNFKKWSEPIISFNILLTFWLENVFRATTACNSTSERPKMVRTWCVLRTLTYKCASRHSGVPFFRIPTSGVHFLKLGCGEVWCVCAFWLQKVVQSWCALYILTWKRAWRHSGVQFFMSALNTWLRTRRFSEPTFGPTRPATFLTFFAPVSSFFWLSRTFIFFLLTLLRLYFSALLFHSPFCRKFDY